MIEIGEPDQTHTSSAEPRPPRPFDAENRVNQAAYLRLRDEIAVTYPKGRFVAIDDGRVVADAGSFEAIDGRLRELGVPRLRGLVVLAGDDTPDFIDIL